MLGRRLSFNMPLMATQYFSGSNSKEKLTIGSQNLVNNIFLVICGFSAKAIIENTAEW